jgi:hypothetical protein
MNNIKVISQGSRHFIKSVLISGAGVEVVPSSLYGNSEALMSNYKRLQRAKITSLLTENFSLPIKKMRSFQQ